VIQLDLFEVAEVKPEAPTLTPGQKVQVNPPGDGPYDPEDYYYLRDFAGKRGYVTEVHYGRANVCYTVHFDGERGVFYHADLTALTQ
jgi:hypothetical protein